MTVSKRSSQEPLRIGIHGPREAGKTCFLGALYADRACGDGTFTFTDDATINYLQRVWKELSEGRHEATAMGLPTQLKVSFQSAKQPSLPLELCDYAGALVQP